jgi:hypothetical protein
MAAPSAEPARRAPAWAAALAALAAATAVAAEVHGRSSRLAFSPPPELRGHPWAAVSDVAGAFRVWRAAGVRGRWVVVLTGRWSRPRDPREVLATAEEILASSGAGGDVPEFVDVENALYAAAQLGIVRRFSVAMTPAALARKEEESRAQPDFEPGARGGSFGSSFHGLVRRFSTPERLEAPPEPALVLLEPSYLEPGAEPPDRVLSSRGLSFDLALVALDDPAATEAQRAAARAFVEAVGAPYVEAEE